jgi:hypothetical protein
MYVLAASLVAACQWHVEQVQGKFPARIDRLKRADTHWIGSAKDALTVVAIHALSGHHIDLGQKR